MDEDCDKMVSWEEFTEMYDRCRKDKTGFLAAALATAHKIPGL